MDFFIFTLLVAIAVVKIVKHCIEISSVRLYEHRTGKFIMNIPRRSLSATEIEARLRFVDPQANYTWDLWRMDAARFGESSSLPLFRREGGQDA